MRTFESTIAKTITVFAAGLILTSCAWSRPSTGIRKFDASKINLNQGTTIFSVGAPASCASPLIYLELQWIDSTGKARSHKLFEALNYVNKSDYTTHHGLLHARNLTPGDYQLVPTLLNVGSISNVTPAKFEVVPYETTYIGEFYFDNGCIANSGNRLDYSIRDQSERDLELVNNLTKDIDVTEVKIDLMQLD